VGSIELLVPAGHREVAFSKHADLCIDDHVFGGVMPGGGTDAELHLLEDADGKVDSDVDAGAKDEPIAGGWVRVGFGEEGGRGVVDDCVEFYVEVLRVLILELEESGSQSYLA
jgi:hypothetical protein